MSKLSRPLSRPQKLGLIAGTVVIIAALAWVLVPRAAQAPAANASGAASKPGKAALTVSVTQATSGEWPQILSANGNITAWQEAIIGAEAGGLRLEEVRANVGDHVRKGQVLARLQSDTLGAELEQSRASLQEAEASQAEAAANAERARQLQTSGAMSAQQINQFLTGERTAQARVAVLKAKIKADEIRLDQTRIVAPDDGSISARLATVGAVVQQGQELFRLIRKDHLEWRAELPSSDLHLLKPGMKATIFSASDTPVEGSLRMVAPSVDPLTRNGLVYVDITQAKDAKAGMFARGEIQLGLSGGLTLPQAAVQMRDGFHYVYRVGPDNKLTQVKVAVGRRVGDRIEISSGVDASHKIVASGVGFLADGDTVRVVDTPTVASANTAAAVASTKAP